MDTIQFRRVTKSDLAMLMDWRMMDQVTKYMYTDPQLNINKQEEWFDKISKDPTIQYLLVAYNTINYAVAHLYDIDLANHRCFWGYYIGNQEYRNNGMAKHISCNIYDYVFDKLKFNKLCGDIMFENRKVIEMAKKRGFDEEGLFKQHIYKNGQFHDVVRVALMRDKWLQSRHSFDYIKAIFEPLL